MNNSYNGTLKKKPVTLLLPSEQDSNASLARYVLYLREISQTQEPLVRFDIERLEQDIQEGMFFDSSIRKAAALLCKFHTTMETLFL